jgi:hypothetical protein
MRLEIKTLRSKHFEEPLKRWWRPSERRAARKSLVLLERAYDDIYKETQKQLAREIFFGESFSKKEWKP